MNQEHTLLLVLGRTASGKDTLINKLCENTGLRQVISYTTRERRVNEGNTHIFATEIDYEQMQSEGKIAAFTQIGSYKYWSTIEQLYSNDCYIIDFIGYKKLKELNLPNLRLVSVFINTPDKLREKRALNQRGDNRESWRARNFAEREQFREMLKNAQFDYAVKNDDFATAYSVLNWITQAEGLWKNKEEAE